MSLLLANHKMVGGSSGGGFIAEYQAVLQQAQVLGYTKPTSSEQQAQNTLFKNIKTGLGSNYSKVKRIYVPANNGSSDFGTLNWVSPTIKQAVLANLPSWVSDRGWISNGTSSYVRIPFLTNEYTGIESNLSTIAYASKVAENMGDGEIFGFRTASASYYLCRPRQSSGNLSVHYYDASGFGIAQASRGGLYHVRNLTGDYAAFRNTTKYAHIPTITSPTHSTDMGLLCRNNTNLNGAFSPINYNNLDYASFMLISEALTDAEHTVIYNAFETYRTAIGLV